MHYFLERRTTRLACCFATLLTFAALSLGTRLQARADSAPAESTTTTAAVDQKIMETAKAGSEIMPNLTYLSDIIGSRLTGSTALKRANDWTAEKMKSYGLTNVHLEAWSIPVGWERGPASARIIEPDDGCQLTIASMAWTPGTQGKIEGDVVILKATNSKELAAYKGKLKNAIIMRGAPSRVIPVGEKGIGLFGERRRDPAAGPARATPNAAAAPNANGRSNPPAAPSAGGAPNAPAAPNAGGAPSAQGGRPAGFNSEPGAFQQMMEFRREFNAFLHAEGAAAVLMDAGKPQGLLNMTGSWQGSDRASAGDPMTTLFVAHEHYALLHRLASRPAPARTRISLDVQNKFIPGPIAVYNTVGEIRGSEKPDEVVVVGGHLDSWDLGQGTTDNGTGSMIVLEAARILNKCGIQPKRTIRFILFTGEEQGLRGSRAYVEQHKDELPRVSMCLVHDYGTGKVVGLGLMGHKELQPILEPEIGSLKALGVTEWNMSRMGGSDHASFDSAGVPGLWFVQDPAEYRFTHHSQSDTLDKANEADLVQGAESMATLAMHVANLPSLLPHHKPQDPSQRRGGRRGGTQPPE